MNLMTWRIDNYFCKSTGSPIWVSLLFYFIFSQFFGLSLILKRNPLPVRRQYSHPKRYRLRKKASSDGMHDGMTGTWHDGLQVVAVKEGWSLRKELILLEKKRKGKKKRMGMSEAAERKGWNIMYLGFKIYTFFILSFIFYSGNLS